MATVFVPPSPQPPLFDMSTRRAPLAQVPNGANSPYRTTGSLVVGKRARPSAGLTQDIAYGQPPPKKQLLSKDESTEHGGSNTRLNVASRNAPTTTAAAPGANTNTVQTTGPDGRVFTRKNPNARPTALERKLEAARESTRALKQEKDNADSIRQWQNFYRKAFPTFVFYFESLPDDVRAKCSKQVVALGARVEKFFSKSITHVVTTRSKIPDIEAPIEHSNGHGQPKTINPSLLERAPDLTSRRHGLDAGSTRKSQVPDILSNAKQFGMKIWQLEKLSRIILTMNDGEGGYGTLHKHGNLTSKHRDDVNLSQVLRNEKMNGPSDRDPSVLQKELTIFKGPFIYIHDMTEQTKPVMVREYPKVANRSQGAWPQFRSTSLGKCPFVEEPPRRDKRDDEQQRAQTKVAPKVRTVATNVSQRVDKETTSRKTEAAEAAGHKRTADDAQLEQRPLDPPRMLPTKLNSQKSSESFVAPAFPNPRRPTGHEPAASGIQPSNITSAIRSQMISSTAAGPGMKAGTSKEVHQLKRKVFEKNSSQLTSGIPRSQSMTDIAGTLRAMRAPASRTAQAKTQEQLGFINEEDTTQSESENKNHKTHRASQAAAAAARKKAVKQDPKPGYCENCRAKYDDFDEHTRSRRHREFANTESNWTELDDLLFQLERPLKSCIDGA